MATVVKFYVSRLYRVTQVRVDPGMTEIGTLRLHDARETAEAELKAKFEAEGLGNTIAREGIDRCDCGCKYWEHDKCIDCGTHVSKSKQED